MLELRPCCEHCGDDLGPETDSARICSFECTFCARCATWELFGVCPNCGGELVIRPRRPANKLAGAPASVERRHRPHDIAAHQTAVTTRLLADDLPSQVWSVGFVNQRAGDASDGYGATADRMDELARQQPGFVGVDSARTNDGIGITISRWSSVAALMNWRNLAEHAAAQSQGRKRWYERYRLDVARIERVAEFQK
jgi:heme-degrading monooxygenase HmoA